MKKFNEGDVVYFISSSVFIKKATVIRNAGGFCTIRFEDEIAGLLEHVFVKVNCIIQKKRQRKLLNNIKMQISGDDVFSTFTLDWRIQYLLFLICSNQEYRCWFASHFLHLQTYW